MDRKLILTPAMLPSNNTVIFEKSSFFSRNPGATLPSPNEVRFKSSQTTFDKSERRPPPVLFPELNLLVKFGQEITIAEGQCLWAIQHLLHDDVPVPEIFGWKSDSDEVFIYMELVKGETLEESWNDLCTDERDSICKQLQTILISLRRLQQDPKDPFIGHIARQPLLDIIFEDACCPPESSFGSVSAFHDWFTTLKRPASGRGPDAPPHPHRSWLPDDIPIVFTHGDLHRSNIIISKKESGARRVLSIIDWHQSGWYPAYWESCKARWTAHYGEEWQQNYLPKILEPFSGYDGWDYFVLRLGC